MVLSRSGRRFVGQARWPWPGGPGGQRRLAWRPGEGAVAGLGRPWAIGDREGAALRGRLAGLAGRWGAAGLGPRPQWGWLAAWVPEAR